MAALLRSARLLKFSPSGSLQITGTKRTGPALSRLFSGALSASSRTGVCPRQIRLSSENASSRVWPHAAGCVRTYAVVTEQKDETSNPVRIKQVQEFDWALAKLDSSVRRTGRITKTLLLRIFHDISRTGYPSGNQALLLLRSCGSLLPEVPVGERSELARHVWEKLQELGAQYDVSHYNALLKVYLQNEFKFSPMDFLAKMEAAKIQPNRVTYQRLIAAYCQNGDIEGASTILGCMKSKDLPITEAVFNSLVTGHARAGDIESAKNILTVMRGAGIEPGPDTYVSLLNAYAEKGDMDSLKKTLETAEGEDCSLMDRDLMQIIFTLAKAGHQQHVPELSERLRHERGYIPDAMNLCLSLITHGLEDTAFHILKTFPTLQSEDTSSDSPNLGNFFLRHCVNMNTPLEKMGAYCKELLESNLHVTPLHFTLFCALEAKKTDMSLQLMKLLKEQGLPVRTHYFWPILILYLKDKNTAGVVKMLKSMQELGVSPDPETLLTYTFPAFSSVDEALQALKDAGVSLEAGGFLASEIRLLAVHDLAEFYARLSDPSFPPLDLSVFRNSLTYSFKKSSDIESMVKITKLLYSDERFSRERSKPAEKGSFFLYSLIDNMSETEVQAQEDKLREYFSQLRAQNITITTNIFRGIRNLLESYHTPDLIKYVGALLDPKEQESLASLSAPRINAAQARVLALEDKLAELKAENKPLGSVLKQVIQALCSEEFSESDQNLQRALGLKQQYEGEMRIPALASLLNLCCRHDNVDEALNLKREISRMDSSALLDSSKYIALVRTLSKNDKVEEALDILKEMKERDVAVDDTNITAVFHMLSDLAAKGDSSTIQRLLDTIFTLGLAKPSANLCSPLITSYLESSDLAGALEALLVCQKHYKVAPRIHDVFVGLVKKGDTELLQKAMDFVTRTRGEMTMLYDLFFAFLQTGRYREARKIIETPGLRARPGRLQWYAERCIYLNQMETLDQLVDMTAKLFECDRDEMYSFILRLCKETNDWEKAEATWTKMQEENIIPRERTLRLLADILKSNNQEVPFEVPKAWYEEADTKQEAQPETEPDPAENAPDYNIQLMALSKKHKAKEALTMLRELNGKGVVLDLPAYDHVIRALLATGEMEEAFTVVDIATSSFPDFQMSDIATSLLIITQSKRGQSQDAVKTMKSMLSAQRVPMHLAITRVIQALGNDGDVVGIQEVESLMKDFKMRTNLSTMVFVNNTALAHIKNDDLDAAVEILEAVYTSAETSSQSMSFVFKKILEQNNDKALDKLSAMAERLAKHFACYRPVSDLFLQLLDMGNIEEAKAVLARCNALADQRSVLVSYVAQKAKTPGQVDKIKTLLSLIPDFADRDVLYTYMMKCHFMNKDLSSGKALYEQMQEKGIVPDELSLKRLAVLYRNAEETAPFPEPPETFKFYANKLKDQVNTARAQAEE